MERAREYVLQQLAGDDKDLRKSIEVRAKEWGEAQSVEDMEKRLIDAATLVRSARPDVQPLNSYAPTTSYQDAPKPKSFVETTAGKDLYKKMFPDTKIDQKK